MSCKNVQVIVKSLQKIWIKFTDTTQTNQCNNQITINMNNKNVLNCVWLGHKHFLFIEAF